MQDNNIRHMHWVKDARSDDAELRRRLVWQHGEAEHVYVTYGVAARDETELVCMFFDTPQQRAEFEDSLPGLYRHLVLTGIESDDFGVVLGR